MVDAISPSIARRSSLRNAMPAIIRQGSRNSSTPEASPNALVARMPLAMPASGSSARPASDDRRASHGTARKNGVDSQVRQATCQSPPTSQFTYSG